LVLSEIYDHHILEGWNNKFVTLVRINHPNIWQLIEALQTSNSSASIKILNYKAVAFRNNLGLIIDTTIKQKAK